MAAFMDLGKTSRDNDLLTIFVIEFIRTFRHSLTSHVGIRSTAQKALDDFFSNCLISVSVKGWNVSIMDMQDSPCNGITCDKVLKRNPSCIFNIFWEKKLLKQWAISLSELIIFGKTVWLLCSTSFYFPCKLWCFYCSILIWQRQWFFNLNFTDLEVQGQ